MTKKESRTIQAEFQFDGNNTPRIPATKLMKTVASKTKNMKNMVKVFSPEEIEEIMARRDDGDELTQTEHKAIREQYRKMKRRVKEMEKGNREKIIAIPSITNKGGFYKLFDFSALYYVYRLANRMGRNARLMSDGDRYSKTLYSASLVDIDKFVEQFKRLENPPELLKLGGSQQH